MADIHADAPYEADVVFFVNARSERDFGDNHLCPNIDRQSFHTCGEAEEKQQSINGST